MKKLLTFFTFLLTSMAFSALNMDEWEIINPVYDHNGNVTELLDGDTGEIIGEYAYDPYGNTIKIKGEAAYENKVRFSTKELDSSGLYYYGYRYYNPKDGRWQNRDPIGERGGHNLYGMVKNNSLNIYDVLGLNSPIPTIPPNDPLEPPSDEYCDVWPHDIMCSDGLLPPPTTGWTASCDVSGTCCKNGSKVDISGWGTGGGDTEYQAEYEASTGAELDAMNGCESSTSLNAPTCQTTDHTNN